MEELQDFRGALPSTLCSSQGASSAKQRSDITEEREITKIPEVLIATSEIQA